MDISCSILDSPTHYSTIPLISSNMVDKCSYLLIPFWTHEADCVIFPDSMILSYALKSIDINKAMSAIRSEYLWPPTPIKIH